MGRISQPALERVGAGGEAEHGEERVGGLEVVQEHVMVVGGVVDGHPVVVPAIDLAPVAAGLPGPRRPQHLGTPEVGQGGAEALRVPRREGVPARGVGTGGEQLDDGAAGPGGQPCAVLLQQRGQGGIGIAGQCRLVVTEELAWLQRHTAEHQGQGEAGEGRPGTTPAGVVYDVRGQVGGAIAQAGRVADGEDAPGVPVAA